MNLSPPRYRVPVRVLILGIWAALLTVSSFPDEQGTDFFPVYIAARSLTSGSSPYSDEVTSQIRNEWKVSRTHHVAPLVAYPLPALFPILPFAMLPLPPAATVWFLFLVVVLAAFILASRLDTLSLVAILAYFPLIHALILKTTSVLWFALAALAIWRFDSCKALQALGIVLLPAKPQSGLLFAFYGMRKRSKIFRWYVGALACVIWGGAFLLDPGWITAWLNRVHDYSKLATTASFLPWGLALLPLTWGLPLATIALAQVIIFPINDLYCALPLMLGWLAFKPIICLIGASISLLGPIMFVDPNSTATFFFTVLAPYLIACAAWQFGRLPRFAALRSIARRELAPIAP